MEKTVNITNFIGTYDGYITKEDCNKAIKLFNKQHEFNKTINRQQFEQVPVNEKQDQQFFATSGNINIWHSELKSLIVNFDMALKHYENTTGIKTSYGVDEFHFTCLKIQKTLPTEGYHIWHVEHGKGFDNEPRALVFSVYLNDVEEGGETEFLHFSKRVKPKTGRIVIWPAAFPYVHRGNPPLSGEKYILTSWMMLR
mgnify:CR=1 FL=1|jgi:hypothetical protein|tara:strand:+ start:2367 stop:2960 length:594 start_codon:yes stop_codon:yes gene_type:complete